MATLPRATKSPSSSAFLDRRYSEFDAGINTSAAWTEHLEQESASDCLDIDERRLKSARALYDFEGKAEFRELSINAGDELKVIREDLADGWSLVRNKLGEIGLLPRTYYTFTSDFVSSPPEEGPLKKEASTESITPRGSPQHETTALPIVPQTTGEWRNAFPSFTRSLLGGKSLNRFSSFVTTGAEDWVLNGAEESSTQSTPSHSRESSSNSDEGSTNRLSVFGIGSPDQHFVESGPCWKSKIPPFSVLVHSPSKRTSSITGAFTQYSVTSLFHAPDLPLNVPSSPVRVTVYRRFSQFVTLHAVLAKKLPGIALPPLPEKQYAGRFSDEFVEARRGDLERYLNKIVRHPVARYAEIVTLFLSCESDTEWKRMASEHLTTPTSRFSFYSRVFHPAFNVDIDEANDTAERFDTHTRAVGKGVQGLRDIFGRLREARIEMSKAERMLSYSLLSLITSKPLASAPTTGISEEEAKFDDKGKGLQNEDGAWCWRENCDECLKLTKAYQKTSETLQNVSDMFDNHARRTQLVTHDALKGVAHPNPLYQNVIDTHRSTLAKHKEATRQGTVDENMASRCETVLNITMAEMETYHTQKNEDFRGLAIEHLDGEIAFYQQILGRLQAARAVFDSPQYDELACTPRQPSIYERELENPRLNAAPLSHPCPHVYDSAPMRPVSVALQEGVGLLLGSGGVGRASVFGKFWS